MTKDKITYICIDCFLSLFPGRALGLNVREKVKCKYCKKLAKCIITSDLLIKRTIEKKKNNC